MPRITVFRCAAKRFTVYFCFEMKLINGMILPARPNPNK